ncbi:hypothetical protein DY000_02024392 [Brassica cretica]|uniref:FLZ-type domain-containing protein n=1 Tax=Brassica cretica TaxID=69181 RepID=A0ABQ7EIU0_BRACR|nr:hypothetical protein DY000_02024392 [Brassica cretica]
MSFTMVNGSSQIRSVLFVSCKDRCNEGVRNHENQCDTETTDQLKYRQCSQVSTRLSVPTTLFIVLLGKLPSSRRSCVGMSSFLITGG